MPTHGFLELPEFLRRYAGQHVYLYPNAGNAGDTIIETGQLQIMSACGMEKVTHVEKPLTKLVGETIFYSGGGNLNELYGNCAQFLEFYAPPELKNQVILLPHSIDGRQELLSKLGHNVTILCRDQITYRHVNANAGAHVYLSHDAAFYLNVEQLLGRAVKKSGVKGPLSALREDREATDIFIPADNVDVSAKCMRGPYFVRENRERSAREFIEFLEGHSHVTTNRLHVAITCGLLGIPTRFHANSYWKNEAVYRHSFEHFGLTRFVTFH
jgi:exopolysaccharide biosynthesis predicted pyruvyltransferase EpsI